MHKRHSTRYDSERLPESLSKVTISWVEDSFIESSVVNCCALGIKVSIPPLLLPTDIPKKNETVKVLMHSDQRWLSGMCVYAANEPDGFISLGIYFYNPSEQNYLNKLLRLSNDLPYMRSFISHEWEELVARLCDSEDPTLRERGYHEREIIKAQREGEGTYD